MNDRPSIGFLPELATEEGNLTEMNTSSEKRKLKKKTLQKNKS
jgi:hypothetical protein